MAILWTWRRGYAAGDERDVKSASKIAQEIVLKWGNDINWARYPKKYGDHISEEDRFRLQRAIARALRQARRGR